MKHIMTIVTLALTSLALMTGCAGYQRGSSVPQELRTVHVPAFINHTDYPMVGAQAAQQFMDTLIEDGTFSLADFESAKLRAEIEITGVGSSAVRYDRNYAILPEEYHLRITAKLFVYKAATGETLINGKSISATDSMLTRGDYQTGLMDALPRLCRQLSHNLLDELQTIR